MRAHGFPIRIIAPLCLLAACAPANDDVAGELMAADRAFAEATATRGAQGWASYFTETGRMYQRAGVVEGRTAIHDVMDPFFSAGPALRWDPDTAIVAASADLGYTLGRWQLVAADGDSVLGTGNYVSIWHRQADGSWKVALDIGNDDAPPDVP